MPRHRASSDQTPQADENERIEIVRWPLDDLDGALAATQDAKTIIGLLWLTARRATERGAARTPPCSGKDGCRRGRRRAAHGDPQRRSRNPFARPPAMAVAPAPAARSFEHHVLDFLAYLEFERGLSRNTLEAYRSDLLQFGAYLDARGVDVARRPATPTSPASSTSWRPAARAARRARPRRCSARPPACAPSTATCAARGSSTTTRPPTCARRARARSCRRSSAAARSQRLLARAARHRPGGAARPRAARADVRLRPARLRGHRPRGRRRRPRTASCAPAARARRSGSCPSGAQAIAAVRVYLERGRPALVGLRDERASCSSTSAAAG